MSLADVFPRKSAQDSTDRQWVPFSKRLPLHCDADADGNVELAEVNGNTRIGMWDWIPPQRLDAKELWHINGFTAWRRIAKSK